MEFTLSLPKFKNSTLQLAKVFCLFAFILSPKFFIKKVTNNLYTIKSQQYLQGWKLFHAVIFFHPLVGNQKNSKNFSRESLTVPKMSQPAHSQLLCFAKILKPVFIPCQLTFPVLKFSEHIRFLPKTKIFPAANQNRARKTLKLRRLIRIE